MATGNAKLQALTGLAQSDAQRRYAAGNNVYGGGISTPNPGGNNQYPKNLADLARKRRKMNLQLNQNQTAQRNSMFTDSGGLYQ